MPNWKYDVWSCAVSHNNMNNRNNGVASIDWGGKQ